MGTGRAKLRLGSGRLRPGRLIDTPGMLGSAGSDGKVGRTTPGSPKEGSGIEAVGSVIDTPGIVGKAGMAGIAGNARLTLSVGRGRLTLGSGGIAHLLMIYELEQTGAPPGGAGAR